MLYAGNCALVTECTLMGTPDVGKENRNDEGVFAGYRILGTG